MKQDSIDEGLFTSINHQQHWLVFRGADLSNPVLLILSGPGVALSAAAPFFAAWEEHFTLVYWDQPGSGATHSVNQQLASELTLDQLVSAGIAVAEFACNKLEVEKIAVLGISGGSVLGLRMMHQQPGRFSAYVGTGQFVNWLEQDKLSYQLLLANARASGKLEAVRELSEIGPPPYADASIDGIKSRYHSAMTEAEVEQFSVFSAIMAESLSNPPQGANYIPARVALENPRSLAMAAYAALRADLLAFDAWSLPMSFAMPIFFIQGEEDVYSITSIVQAYEREINAPAKATLLVAGGGHSVFWLRDRFLQLLNQHVRPVIST
ncbi:MAG: alpha/beta hydrolase [Pseudomonadales bacterium]|nr:alpha/beta hydrolase [Pseudomonadales bacterium]